MTNGWRFSVTIPSWTQTMLAGDEAVVFYRVEIKVLPPETTGPPRCRSVLRRFSHFTKLYVRLREELGPKALARRPPPPKRALWAVNARPERVEARRAELEQWLWRLVADPLVARSAALNVFLELTDAARIVSRAAGSSAAGSYTMSEGGASGGDAASVASDLPSVSEIAPSTSEAIDPAPPATFRAMSSLAGSADLARTASWGSAAAAQSGVTEPAAAPGVPALRRAASEQGANGMPVRAMSTAAAAAASGAGPGTEGGGRMRLGLHVEQRGSVRRHMAALQQRLDRAASDLQDAVEAIRAEQASKRGLVELLRELDPEAGSAVPPAAAAPPLAAGDRAAANLAIVNLRQEVAKLQATLRSAVQVAGSPDSIPDEDNAGSGLEELQQPLHAPSKPEDLAAGDAGGASAGASSGADGNPEALREQHLAELAALRAAIAAMSLDMSRLAAQVEEDKVAAAEVMAKVAQRHAALECDCREAKALLAERTAAAAAAQGATQADLHALRDERDTARYERDAARAEAGVDLRALRAEAKAAHDALRVARDEADAARTEAATLRAVRDEADAARAEAGALHEELRKARAQREVALAAEAQARAEAEAKRKADMKLLAKEVKTLRKAVEAERARADEAAAALAAAHASDAPPAAADAPAAAPNHPLPDAAACDAPLTDAASPVPQPASMRSNQSSDAPALAAAPLQAIQPPDVPAMEAHRPDAQPAMEWAQAGSDLHTAQPFSPGPVQVESPAPPSSGACGGLSPTSSPGSAVPGEDEHARISRPAPAEHAGVGAARLRYAGHAQAGAGLAANHASLSRPPRLVPEAPTRPAQPRGGGFAERLQMWRTQTATKAGQAFAQAPWRGAARGSFAEASPGLEDIVQSRPEGGAETGAMSKPMVGPARIAEPDSMPQNASAGPSSHTGSQQGNTAGLQPGFAGQKAIAESPEGKEAALSMPRPSLPRDVPGSQVDLLGMEDAVESFTTPSGSLDGPLFDLL